MARLGEAKRRGDLGVGALDASPREIKTEMATTEMKARIKAYSTRVCPLYSSIG